MGKTIFIVGLLFSLVSCNHSKESSSSVQSKNYEVQEAEVDEVSYVKRIDPIDETESSSQVPNEASMFDASIIFKNFGVSDKEKIYKAIDIIKLVISSEEFRQQVINFSYKGNRQFVDAKMTNEQVYNKLLEASETLIPGIDHEMDLSLELYYSSKNTVGYTYANVTKIWMNSKYFKKYTPAQVAGNIFHEWTHKLGFTHAYKNTAGRSYSVPYALGYLMRDLGKKYE